MKKRIASIVLGVCLCFALLSAASFAAESAGGAPADELDVLETAYLGTVGLDSGISLLDDEENKAPLKDEVGVKWIDRLDLTGDNAWGKTFYETLEEAVDNDGVKDYLIDDKYFKGAVSDDDDDANYWSQTSGGKNYYLLKVTEYSDTSDYNQKVQLMTAVYGAFLRDHPEVFWLSGDIGYANTTDAAPYKLFFMLKGFKENGTSLDVRASDYQSAETIKAAIAAQNSAVSSILAGAPSGGSTYDLVQYFNNKLTTTNQYNTDPDNSPASARRGLTALQGGTGETGPVCEGYSKAFKILCDQKSIPCVLVTGNSHMWNYVQMDNGKWYAVDVTGNDPVSSDESTVGAVSGNETENHLLVGSDTEINGKKFSVDHPVENAMFNDSEYKYTNGPTIETAKYDPSTAGKVDQIISAEPVTVTYGDTGQYVSATVTSADDKVTAECGALSYAVTEGEDVVEVDSYGELAIKKAGTATVTVTAAGTDVYNVATATVPVTISPLEAKLKWNNVDYRYWNDGKTVTATVTNKVNDDDVSVTVSNGGGNEPHDWGYLAEATGLTGKDAGNYRLPDDTKLTQKTYRIGKVSYTGETTISGSAPYGNPGEVDLSDLIAEGTESLTVSDENVTDSDDVLTGTPSVSGNKLNFTFANDEKKIGKTATVKVQVSGLYYANYEITVTLSVSDRLPVPVVKPNPINREYSGSHLTDADITGDTGGVDGTWSWFSSSAPFRVTGSTVPYQVVFTPDDPKYKPTKATVNVTITPAPVTITGLTVEDKTYDGTTAATVSGTPRIVGLKNESDQVTVSSEESSAAFESKDAGAGKTVVFSGYSLDGTEWGNYELTSQPTSTATINPKEVTVSGVTAVDRTYNGTNTVTLCNGTVVGAVAGDDVKVDLTDAVGTVSDNSASETPRDVTVSGVKLSGADADNYTLTAQPTGVTVVISKNQQTITAPAVTATYGDTGVKVVPSGTHGDVSYAVTTGDCVSVDNDGNVTLLKAGTATITVTAAGDDAYAVGMQTVTVTVNKRVISVKANDKSMTVNGTLPTFDVTYGNFAAGDTKESVIANEATASVAADGKTTGSFDITVTADATLKDGMAEKYEFGTAEKGTLTVNSAPAPSPSPSTGGGFSGGNSSSNFNSTTTKNPDGSTTTTITDKTTGTVTETTKNTDGSTSTIETKKDGTVTETNKTATGTTATTVTDKNGNSTTTVSVSKKDAQSGEIITLPVDEVRAAGKSEDAQEITVNVPSGCATIEVPVKNPTPGTVIVIVDKDGNETVVPTTKLTENGVTVTLTEDATIKVIENSRDFSDVKSSDYFDKAVDWASSRGITGGNSATTFGPHDSCTRAQLVTFLWRAAGQPAAKSESGMNDVAMNAYYTDAVAWAFENGIVGGYGNGLFGSGDAITREQMAVILYRFAQAMGMDTTQGGMSVREYKDYESISDYAVAAIQWAVNAGVMQGYDGNLMPGQPCTRAQIVTMLYRLLGA